MVERLPVLDASRCGYHRGYRIEGVEYDSLEAVRRALKHNPFFIEIDVQLFDGEVWTGHLPGQEPLDRLEDILPLFKNEDTFPKIDIKLLGDDYGLIDKVIELVRQSELEQIVVINIDAGEDGLIESGGMDCFAAELYLAEKVNNDPKIQLNIDLARYRKMRADDKKIEEHIKKLQEDIKIWSISLEIHNGEIEKSAELALKYRIPHIVFWIVTTIDGKSEAVTKQDIGKALDLEMRYPTIQVYFDIDPQLLEVNFL